MPLREMTVSAGGVERATREATAECNRIRYVLRKLVDVERRTGDA